MSCASCGGLGTKTSQSIVRRRHRVRRRLHGPAGRRLVAPAQMASSDSAKSAALWVFSRPSQPVGHEQIFGAEQQILHARRSYREADNGRVRMTTISTTTKHF